MHIEKVTQKSVKYELPAKGGQCRACEFHIPGGYCVKVQSPISPAGGCKLFQKLIVGL
jgi:hypothetical protein